MIRGDAAVEKVDFNAIRCGRIARVDLDEVRRVLLTQKGGSGAADSGVTAAAAEPEPDAGGSGGGSAVATKDCAVAAKGGAPGTADAAVIAIR